MDEILKIVSQIMTQKTIKNISKPAKETIISLTELIYIFKKWLDIY